MADLTVGKTSEAIRENAFNQVDRLKIGFQNRTKNSIELFECIGNVREKNREQYGFWKEPIKTIQDPAYRQCFDNFIDNIKK